MHEIWKLKNAWNLKIWKMHEIWKFEKCMKFEKAKDLIISKQAFYKLCSRYSPTAKWV